MATSIHPSIPVLSPSFLYHPYIPSLESKDFSFTCLLSFFGCTRPITFLFYSLRNILPEAICCCLATSYFYAALLDCVMYMYADFQCYNCKYGPVIGIFIDRLPEAMCCCLQTYTVNDALLVMYCMCLLAVIVTSADIRKLWIMYAI